MENPKPDEDTTLILDNVKSLFQAELSKAYVIGLKNLHLISPALSALFIFLSGCYLGLTVFVICITYLLAGTLRAAAMGGAILGALTLLALIVFVSVAFKERFWIQIFKIDQMIQDAAAKVQSRQPGQHPRFPGNPEPHARHLR